ncbi:MAG: hypothetical protein NZM06_05500 [Chloroherpetonaceae bacterium]|nr:hypothetical protein [Chloroherpetonaceae bacterium]MDW8438080.1 hypothetical protein [Chloroherpetonaceae bacterium]
MRHRLFAFSVLFWLSFPESSLAQRYAFDQGSVRLSGSISYANYGGALYQPNVTARIESDRITEFSFRPSLAYFLFERVAVGAEIVYAAIGQNDKNNVVTLFSRTTWGVGPSVAYFFGERQTSAFPFLSASYVYQSVSEERFEPSVRARSTGASLRVSGGMAIMFGKQASLNFEAFYRADNRNVRNVGKRSGNVFGIDVGASLFIF